MLKHQHHEFPSDIFMLLETVGATLQVRTPEGQTLNYSPMDFLSISMRSRVLLSISMPTLTSKHHFMSYKITPRSQNAHAYVNGAFLAEIDSLDPTFVVSSRPNIVFGGINADFIHASQLEDYLVFKDLALEETLQSGLAILDTEVVPTPDPVLASEEFRLHLTKALFYKVRIDRKSDLFYNSIS